MPSDNAILMQHFEGLRFLAMTKEELNGKPLDVLLVTGDAYVDHPSWGIAVIGRWLEAHGYTVGIIAQPDWTDLKAFQILGRPRLFVGVTAGNMDSMVNKFTSSRHVRNKSAYSPDGQIGLRPDRATIAYTAKVKQAFKGVPVVIGGIEASLRRLVHYDYWQDKIRGSILLDSKADLLVHGMGEHQVVEIANRLNAGQQIKDCWDINGVLYALGAKDPLPKDAILLPSLEDCRKNGRAFAAMTVESYRQANPHCGKPMMQAHGSRWIVQMPPAVPLTTEELDKVHELPYTNQAHPAYTPKFPPSKAFRVPLPLTVAVRGLLILCPDHTSRQRCGLSL